MNGQQATDSAKAAGDPHPPYAIAGAVAAVVFVIYFITIAPTIQFWDTAEYVASAKVLGIPHPPGSPLFTLIAHVWGELPLAADYGLRLNLFAAVTSALASGLLFLVTERFLRATLPGSRWIRISAAAAGILVGATSFTVWNQSVVNEKVYTLSLLSIALILWLIVRWGDEPKGTRRDHWLLLILFLLALSATNHLMALLVAPAVFVFMEAQEAEERLLERTLLGIGIVIVGVLVTLLFQRGRNPDHMAEATVATALIGFLLWFAFSRWGSTGYRIVIPLSALAMAGLFLETARTGSQAPLYLLAALVILALIGLAIWSGHWRLVAWSAAAVLVGLSAFTFLYFRARQYPPINEGEPTTWEALKAVLAREQYQKGPLIPRQANIWWQYLNYVQYFGWQFAHDWSEGLRKAFTLLFGGLGLFGAVVHWVRDKRSALTMTVLMVTVTVALVFYLNFKYGFSLAPTAQSITEVRERDYFFIASFQLWGIWVALGLAGLVEGIAGLFHRAGGNAERSWALASPALLLAIIPLVGNHQTASRAGERLARDFAWDILQSVEPYSILVVGGDNDTFPLWYLQEVEGVRRDVLLPNTSLMNTEWHNRQLKRKPIVPFDSANAIPLYQGRSWPEPTEPVVTMSYQEIDSLAPAVRVEPGTTFRLGPIRATVQTQYLSRSDLMLLLLIQENMGKRPIYISHTVGSRPDALGLGPYLLTQGMVRRLFPDTVRVGGDTISTPALGLTDRDRTATLLFDVYHPESAARHRPQGWVDRPSEGIMQLYWLMYGSMAEYYLGETSPTGEAPDSLTGERMRRAIDLATRIRDQTRFGQQ